MRVTEEDIIERMKKLSDIKFSELKRSELTELGRAVYDREAKRRGIADRKSAERPRTFHRPSKRISCWFHAQLATFCVCFLALALLFFFGPRRSWQWISSKRDLFSRTHESIWGLRWAPGGFNCTLHLPGF